MVTEFGGHPNDGCHTMLQDMIKYLAENEVYIGWTAWAAGPLWGINSPCCADNGQFGSLEPGSRGADGGPGYYETVWNRSIQPLVPAALKRSGVSSVNGCEDLRKRTILVSQNLRPQQFRF